MVVVVGGLLAVLVVGATKSDHVAQTLGVAPVGPISLLSKGDQLCQRPIALADDFEVVRFTLGTTAKAAPAVTVTLRSLGSRRVLGSGRLEKGYDVSRPQTVRVGHVAGGPDAELCFANEGPARVALYGDVLNASTCTATGTRHFNFNCVPGSVRPTLTTSAPFVDGKQLGSDVSAAFLRDEKRSLLARVPDMMRRASLFRPGFVTPALWWVLIAAWLLAAPAGLAYGLSRARSTPGRADAGQA